MIFLTETKCKIRSIYVGWRNFFASNLWSQNFVDKYHLRACLPLSLDLDLPSPRLLLVSCSDTGGQEVIWGEQLFCVTWHDFLRERAPWLHLHLQPKLQRHCQQSRSQYQSWQGARGWPIPDTDKSAMYYFASSFAPKVPKSPHTLW